MARTVKHATCSKDGVDEELKWGVIVRQVTCVKFKIIHDFIFDTADTIFIMHIYKESCYWEIEYCFASIKIYLSFNAFHIMHCGSNTYIMSVVKNKSLYILASIYIRK